MTVTITTKTKSGSTATIGGTATPGRHVRGSIGSTPFAVIADDSGSWSASAANQAGVVALKAREFEQAFIAKRPVEKPGTRIELTGEAIQNTVRPTIAANLFLDNGATTQDRIMIVEYRLASDTEWTFEGTELTDANGDITHVFANVLEDGDYQVRVTAGTVANGLIEIISNTLPITTDKPNEAPVMPPSYDTWIDTERNGKFGFLASMYVTQGATAGTPLGRVLPLNSPKPAVTYSVSDVDFAVDSATGMLALNNASKAAGSYYITVTASNIAGSASVTVPVVIVPVTGLTRTFFVDDVAGDDTLNNGKTPATPFKTFSKANNIRGADIFSTYTVLCKRGTEQVVTSGVLGHNLRNYTVIGAYGDPAADAPHFRTTVAAGAAIGSNISGTLTNVILRDLKVTGVKRGVELSDGTGCSFIRLRFEKNDPTQFGNAIYLHGYVNSVIYHCDILPGINGDGVYLRKFRQGRVRWCTFGIPYGTGSDNLQITSERKSGMEPADVEVSDNVFRHSVLSNAQKGNCVIEGASRVVFERNDCEGNYFCISSLSNFVTIRDNYLRGAILNDNSFGIGTGAIVHTRDQRWIFNRIEGNWYAMAISGYDDPDGLWQRSDYEVLYNHTRKNKAFFKQDRPASGFFTDNVAEQNGNNGFTGSGGLATLNSDYTTLTRSPNFVNTVATDDPAVKPTISGTVSAGQTLTVNVPAISGATSAVQWLINDQRTGSTDLTFVVPAGQVVNPNMPTYRNAPTIACAVIYTFTDGRTLILPARFDDGWSARAIV